MNRWLLVDIEDTDTGLVVTDLVGPRALYRAIRAAFVGWDAPRDTAEVALAIADYTGGSITKDALRLILHPALLMLVPIAD